VPLQAGDNTLTAVATDTLGHVAQDTVTLDTGHPWPWASANPATFAPLGAYNTTQFDRSAQPPVSQTITGWRLAIASVAQGTPVTQTMGTNLPHTVTWDGRDAGGQVVAAGAYSYSLVVTASNGLAEATAPQTVTVVSGPPPAPVIAEPGSGTNTSINQIWVAGSAEPGSTVAVFDTGGHFTDTVAVDGNGDWGLTRSLAGGANVVYAIAENAYGTGPASNQVGINLVPTPPLYSPTIVLPATAYNGQIVTFSAPARNNKPQEGAPTAAVTATLHTNVFNLSLVSGGTAITGTWETTWTVSGLNNGDYCVRFTGVDQDGIEGYGQTTLRVQGIPQAPEFTYPTGAITRSISTLNVRGYAQAFTRLRLYADGALLATIPLGSTGMWQVPVTLSDGTHVITATTSDQWGQVSPPGTAGLITVDTVSPTVTIQELAPYQNQITVTLRWDGNDPPPGTGVLNYDLKHQFGSAGSWLTLQYGTPLTEWVYTAGQEGTYNFRVLARDRAFNSSAWTETGTMVDLTEPGLSLALSSAPPFGHATTGTVYYGDGSGVFTLTGVTTDTLAGLFSLAFPEATDAGATYGLGGATTATRSHPYAFDSNDTFSATLTVTATDRAGNQTTQPLRVIEDTTAPTVTIRVPPVAPLRFWVSWSGQDGESGLRDYAVQYKVGISGTWTSWLTHTTQTQAPFVGERG
jgi:hypothetical protein